MGGSQKGPCWLCVNAARARHAPYVPQPAGYRKSVLAALASPIRVNFIPAASATDLGVREGGRRNAARSPFQVRQWQELTLSATKQDMPRGRYSRTLFPTREGDRIAPSVE
jgi:hypothetical protein